MESVHYHAGICYTLGWGLAIVLAQAEAELIGEAVLPVLRAPGLTGEGGTSRASAPQAQVWGMRQRLGGVDRVVHPNGAV
jgi:hypothetical protein